MSECVCIGCELVSVAAELDACARAAADPHWLALGYLDAAVILPRLRAQSSTCRRYAHLLSDRPGEPNPWGRVDALLDASHGLVVEMLVVLPQGARFN